MSARAFWDTNVLIYWIEDAPVWRDRVGSLRAWQAERSIRAVTSSLTLGEILVHPVRKGQDRAARDYANLIRAMGCLAFGPDEAETFASIRARHPKVRPPDAIQLACAARSGVEWFITNDARLSGLSIPGLGRIVNLAEGPPRA